VGDAVGTDDLTFTVGELGAAIRAAVVAGLPETVWVRGEVSRFSSSAAGHAYFDLVEKDEGTRSARAVLSVALFKGSRAAVDRELKAAGLRLAAGVELRIRGRVDFYAPSGRLQLIMNGVDPVFTVGQMAADRSRLLRTLSDEGVLRANARWEMPLVPLRVGLVTSADSAAYHDFVQELVASGFAFRVTLVDTRVQGPTAAGEVARALRRLAREPLDAVVVARGGGAKTDLIAFDTEEVARAVVAMPFPVITGIGHEIDRSVADEVAHTAAKTPTAAAGVLVGRVAEFDGALLGIAAAVAHRSRTACGVAALHLRALDHRVRRAAPLVTRSAARSVAGHERAVVTAGRRATRDASRTLDAVAARVRALDPRRVLERGYSITRTPEGRVLRTVGGLAADAVLVTEVADGSVTSRVTDTRPTGVTMQEEST